MLIFPFGTSLSAAFGDSHVESNLWVRIMVLVVLNPPPPYTIPPPLAPPPPSPPPACQARGYEYVGCGCDPSSTCSVWGSNEGGSCCGTDGGLCGSEWMSSDPTMWIDVGCGLDFIRVSEGCGVEVATGVGGSGTRYTYESSVQVCECACLYQRSRMICLLL